MSLAGASLVGSVANWILLASLIGGVISTFMIVKTADVKEAHWDEDRNLSNEKIAMLNKEAARLIGENFALQKALTETHHALADRYIWADASSAMHEALSKFSGIATRLFVYPASSPDTFTLGLMVCGILEGAGWRAVAWDMHAASPIPGISILYREGVPKAKEAAEALATSLSDAKIPFVIGPEVMKADEPVFMPPAPATVALGDSSKIDNEETIRIFVGGKENPFR